MSRPPRRRIRRPLLLLAVLVTGGCAYGFSGGGGLPPHVESVYVPPVENETTRFALAERLTQGLLDAVRGRLGGQVSSEGDADAIVRATVTRYSDEALSFEAREGVGADVFQRRVTITASIEIYDVQQDEMIWSSRAVTGTGEYAPDEESEDAGLEVALENLIQRIVDGAQSQW